MANETISPPNVMPPIYGVALIEESPGKSILICETQRATEAAEELLGKHYVPISWTDVLQLEVKTRWPQLFKGRKLLIWPSACPAAMRVAYEIAGQLAPHFIQIKIVHAWEATL